MIALRLLLPLAVAALFAGCAQNPPPAPLPKILRVMAFNDLHGYIDGASTQSFADPAHPGTPFRVDVGGAAAIGGLVQALRASADASLLVHSGDMVGASPLPSTLFRHESTIEAMNAVGVDVAAVGNHDFDAGVAELKRLINGGCADASPAAAMQSCALHPFTGVRFPVLSANVLEADGKNLLAASRMLQVKGLKVGVIGAITKTTPTIVVPTRIVGLTFQDEVEPINRAAKALKAEGAQVILLSIHEGGEIGGVRDRPDWNDESCPMFRGRIVPMARQLAPEIDVILSGHSHQGYRCQVDGRWVVQAGSYGRGLSVLDLPIDPATGRVDRAAIRTRNLPAIAESTAPALRDALAAAQGAPWDAVLRAARPSASVAALVKAYSDATAPRAQTVIGRIHGRFERDRRIESVAGRLVADSQLAATRDAARGGAQIAFMNSGGVRANLECRSPPCPVTYGDAFAVQPFGNPMITVSLSGTELKALLEQQQPEGRAEPNFMSHSEGFSYRWHAKAPAGQHVSDMRLNGQLVAPGQVLRVAGNGFIAEGGDGYTMFIQGRERVAGPIDTDALVDFLRAAEQTPVAAPRIEIVD